MILSNFPTKKGLPSGTTEGQILYWGGANGPEWGDKPVMYVNITESGGTYSADKTAQEIYEAYQNGYAVFAVPWDNDIPILLLSYTYKGNTANEYVASFLASYFTTFYQVIIQDITNFVMFASATLSANDISFTPTSTLTSDNVQDAIEEVDTQLSTKLTTPTGTAGQFLGFTADNTVGAVDAPESGLTQEQADERYLQLTGGTMTGSIMASFGQDFGIRFDEERNNIAIGSGGPVFSVSATNNVEVYSEPTTANGVANKAYVDSREIYHVDSSAPSNTNLLWIDTNSTTGGLKYYNGNSWVHVPVAYS